MKKNLRIVSAAAAALLAVAPVAASAVSTVSAADTTATTTTSAPQINLGGTTADVTKNTVDVTPSLTLTGKSGKINGSLVGSVTATLNGQSYTTSLKNTAAGDVAIFPAGNDTQSAKVNASDVKVGSKYDVEIDDLGLNFGTVNKGKTVTIKSSNANVKFGSSNSAITVSTDKKTATVKLDQNGTATGLTVVLSNVTAFDPTNSNDVVFYNVASGERTNTGNTTVLADYNGQLSASAVLAAIKSNFVAVQRTTNGNGVGNGSYNDNGFASSNGVNPQITINTTSEDVVNQLKAEGIDVNANGYFNAKHSFTVNIKATSEVNGKTKELPVTVTVANVADPVVQSQPKTIMHNAYYYKEDGTTRANNDKAKRYESVNVAMSTKKIGNKDFYEVIKDGKATGMYINADNIDGTKRTLKHNAYVYKTSKKRANKVVLKKGDTVVTYGGTYTFKNGKQYYKINNNTEKTYVKASNF
ncbi:silent surface layer protein [Lactobacillus crispatus]|uniref:SLAP domain-containing protein n=1 Tax=Lactobacillus crispatus TaxID=47770 RepID=UPI0018E302C1|nr:SLAP domain-containing protein [Lactobacillus crispatus]MBI1698763.1 silent surface layer protein [Lactobacillus crispatus]